MRLIILFILVCFTYYSHSQTNYTNKVIDQNDVPVPGLLIQDPDGICKTITNAEGYFEFRCNAKISSLQVLSNGELISVINISTTPGTLIEPVKIITEKPLLDNSQINVVDLPSNEESTSNTEEVSSVLSASKDVFTSIAGFSFSAASFNIRGYDGDLQTVYINGIPYNNPENGSVFFGSFGGLNDVMRTDQFITGLNPGPYGFGNFGGNVIIDATAATQRTQKKFSYLITNRAYTHRIMASWSTGILRSGWAFSFSASKRWAQEGYVEGTSYDAYSYFAAAEKRFINGDNFAITIFGSPTIRGKAGVSIQEMYDLAGTNYYNSNWGYQQGEKRNARVYKSHLPMAIINYNKKLSPNTLWSTALSFQTGREGTTNLDWYNAPDPRPDYYKYLPSYAQDPETAAQIEAELKNNKEARQINWESFYEINTHNFETISNANGIQGDTVSGPRSLYFVNEKRSDNTTATLNTHIKHKFSDQLSLQLGYLYKWYQSSNFKTLEDLLGGSFIVDVDQFAERDFPGDTLVFQNDLSKPNRIVKQGDKYAFNYLNNIRQWAPWTQLNVQLRKFDIFLAASFGKTSIWREGLVQNGRAPENSLGKGQVHHFTTLGIKAGVTLKISNQNYLYANTGYTEAAPQLKDMYISPEIRDDVANNLTTEKLLSGEAGYLLRMPLLRARLSFYYSKFRDLIQTKSYYDDFEHTFINYTLSKIGKIHMGTELGLEYKLSPSVSFQAAANIGDYFFDTRPSAKISKDNSSEIIAENRTIYIKDFFVGNTPQTALGLGLKYNSRTKWYGGINFNYFDRMYIDIAANRRTAEAVTGIDETNPLWSQLLFQEKLDDGFTIDLSVGKAWLYKKHYINFNLYVNNLLNNTSLRTGGFEQLRYNGNPEESDKFPSKYFYMYGLSFSANLSVSF